MKKCVCSFFFTLLICGLAIVSCQRGAPNVSFSTYPTYSQLTDPHICDLARNHEVRDVLNSKSSFNTVLHTDEQSDAAGFEFDFYGNRQRTLLWKGAIPFARYWQLKD